jgi:hypothetical protein
MKYIDFCEACKSSSSDVSAGNILSINFIGRGFIGSSNRCATCESVERNLYFFFLIPLLPLGKWRVKNIESNRLMTRKVTASSFMDLDDHRTYTAAENKRWHLKLVIGFVIFLVLVNIIARIS